LFFSTKIIESAFLFILPKMNIRIFYEGQI
jgi:hypothetical protein